ncbi:MAG TPA: hypothetical protein VGM29_01395 [Polyangiaceae bacterium]
MKPVWLIAAVVAVSSSPRSAAAQACCAGSSVVTPGRLALHEAALVGTQWKAAAEIGSFDSAGEFSALTRGASELDLEQDAFAALRLTEHAQAAVLVPILETRRSAGSESEFGGGIGDINLNGRYDFTFAGASKTIPGIGVLAGITFPSGTPADSSRIRPLATDATGIGAFQGSFGLALEQAFGHWLVNVTGVVAQRSARSVTQAGITTHEQLAAQWTALAAAGYVFDSEAALALSFAYMTEGDATIDRAAAPDSSHRSTTVTFAGLLPLNDSWRAQAALFANPPVSKLSLNQPALAGGSLTLVYAWL